MTFLAYRVEDTEQGMKAQWQTLSEDSLPEGDVLIEVHYSSLNYKDVLSVRGNRGVTRQYPHTPGIDAAGVVLESRDAGFQAGDEVVVIGYDLGMNTAGGFAQKIRVPAHWVLRRPEGMSLASCMSWGTAGLTAALSVQKLERAGIHPSGGPVIVSGATGGVGSVAVALLAKLGYEVVAITNKHAQHEWLIRLGAQHIVNRNDVLATAGKALAKPIYQAALDTVGGEMLEALVPQISAEGAVSTCGMIAGLKLELSIFPFILRGVSLLGVDSVEIPLATKQMMLDKVANEWKLEQLGFLTQEIGRHELADTLNKIHSGDGVGRYRLNLNQ